MAKKTKRRRAVTPSKHADRVEPDQPASPRTATDVERSDRRHRKTRAADPRDGASERARDVIEKGGDPDAAAY